MSFGERLKELRQENNMSQEQLAKKLNISRQAISKWESNNSYPDIENLVLLKEIFNTTLDYLIINEDINKEVKEDINEIVEDKESKEIDNNRLKKEKISLNNIYIKNDKEDDEDDEENSVSLILGCFMISMAIGLITENYYWCAVGAPLGFGLDLDRKSVV